MTKKILIVEDEESILALLSEILGTFDHYVVFSARDGEEGLRIARADTPDIILLDVRLPKISGYEVCRAVKSDPTMRHTKVLMLSGFTQRSDRKKAKQVGADDYIAKPFSSTELVERVEKLLGGSMPT